MIRLTEEAPLLVVEDFLHGDHVCRVRTLCPNCGHYGDQNMLLDGEWARVQFHPEDPDTRHKSNPYSSNGEDKKLGHELIRA
jgi:hypothetical protein